jgi:hypothetical protein
MMQAIRSPLAASRRWLHSLFTGLGALVILVSLPGRGWLYSARWSPR